MACSWNLGNTSPPRDLSQWILPGHAIYAIGATLRFYLLELYATLTTATGVQEGRYEVNEGEDAADRWKVHSVFKTMSLS
jgi:hypothetical protein